jgi:hypothetical protein
MNRHDFYFAGLEVICFSAAAACSISSGGESPGGACPTSIAGAQGANNTFDLLNGAVISGDYSGPDGSATFVAVCTNLVPQALSITLSGAKPAVGATYAIAGASGNMAAIEYGEGPHGDKVWSATGGSVKIESVARDSVGLSFTQIVMAPDASKNGNTASGTLTLSGSGKADDVIGFVP